MTSEDGHPVRKCVTPGCPVHVYPGPFCSDCQAATVPLKLWRQAVRIDPDRWNLRPRRVA